MDNYLSILINAPLASWRTQDYATNYRPTDKIPSKSALLGMAGAALGYRRRSEEIKNLHLHTEVGLRVDKMGKELRDFQTVTKINLNLTDQKRLGSGIRTRKEELLYSGKEGRGPIQVDTERQQNQLIKKNNSEMTYKFFRQNALYVAVYRLSDKSPCDVEELKIAFHRPYFGIYFGEKCCLPASPFYPKIHRSTDWEEVLESRDGFLDLCYLTGKDPQKYVKTFKPDREILFAVPNKKKGKGWVFKRRDHCINPYERAFLFREEQRYYKKSDREYGNE